MAAIMLKTCISVGHVLVSLVARTFLGERASLFAQPHLDKSMLGV